MSVIFADCLIITGLLLWKWTVWFVLHNALNALRRQEMKNMKLDWWTLKSVAGSNRCASLRYGRDHLLPIRDDKPSSIRLPCLWALTCQPTGLRMMKRDGDELFWKLTLESESLSLEHWTRICLWCHFQPWSCGRGDQSRMKIKVRLELSRVGAIDCVLECSRWTEVDDGYFPSWDGHYTLSGLL